MSGDDGPTGTRDDLLVVALARGDHYAAAGQAAGVSEFTVRRRMADPEFRRAVSRMRGELVDAACGEAVVALSGAIGTLVRLLGSGNDSVALGAARSLVDCAVRLREGRGAGGTRVRIGGSGRCGGRRAAAVGMTVRALSRRVQEAGVLLPPAEPSRLLLPELAPLALRLRDAHDAAQGTGVRIPLQSERRRSWPLSSTSS